MTTRTGTLIIAVLVAALGCKEPARAVPPGPPPENRTVEETPPPRFVETPPPPEQKKSCGQDHVKDFVRLKEQAVAMQPLMRRLKADRIYLDFIDGIREAARRRAFGEIPGVIDAAVEELAHLDRGGNVPLVFERSARARVGAYATCMSLADDDISWCTSLDEEWTGERTSCQVMHAVLTRIAVRAVREGGDCATVMAGSPEVIGLKEKHWVAMCQAVKDRDPEKCPSGIDDKVASMCKATAERDGREHCKALAGERSGIWEPCCLGFVYRVAVVIEGKADPSMSPEMAALSGDREGCERALAWRLVQDTAQISGIDGAPQSPVDAQDSEDYVCRFQVYHSVEKLPGEAP
jgi:hypothetical protein